MEMGVRWKWPKMMRATGKVRLFGVVVAVLEWLEWLASERASREVKRIASDPQFT
jgi:hypothetical protein